MSAPGIAEKTATAVLVVDDDSANRLLAVRWLERAGVAAVEAESGRVALELLRARPDAFGAVLLDVMMPGMSGYEVLDEIQADPDLRPIPVVVLTAHAQQERDVVQVLRSGAVDHVAKPFRGPVLAAKMRVLVERREGAQASRVDFVPPERPGHAGADGESLAANAQGDGGPEASALAAARVASPGAERAGGADPAAPEAGELDAAAWTIGDRVELELELRRKTAFAARHGEPLALMMVGLGRTGGDWPAEDSQGAVSTLRQLRRRTRCGDRAFRIEGSVFALLMVGADRASALQAARRLVSLPEEPWHLRAGVAVADHLNGFRGADLLARADRALQNAKADRDGVGVEPVH